MFCLNLAGLVSLLILSVSNSQLCVLKDDPHGKLIHFLVKNGLNSNLAQCAQNKGLDDFDL